MFQLLTKRLLIEVLFLYFFFFDLTRTGSDATVGSTGNDGVMRTPAVWTAWHGGVERRRRRAEQPPAAPGQQFSSFTERAVSVVWRWVVAVQPCWK